MSIATLLVILLILVLVGVLPTWPHSRAYGYGPSGAVAVLLVIILILILVGKVQL